MAVGCVCAVCARRSRRRAAQVRACARRKSAIDPADYGSCRGIWLTMGYSPFLRPVVVGGGRVVWGCGGGAGVGGGGARARPAAGVWRGAAVLHWCWPPSPCRVVAPCGLCLVDGGGGWCCCGAVTHAARSVAACNRGPPSSASSSTSSLSRPVLPRRLWRVVCWVGFL
jgi:hypothetical protein